MTDFAAITLVRLGGSRSRALYVLDEPTTGLHPADVDKLLVQLNELVDAGHTVVIVEHEMTVVARCDWVIDVGPGAGDEGGSVIACGAPADLCANEASVTGRYLRSAMPR
ncbi:excinuclease UvrABC ATPase subunit [Variovorax ginsengisoli]|uniref:UvrABC system protein A n=1 Tax=Variovorax ginsengisoli TaxID=363844 RepID=A0ABT9S8P8_9BURK|nr:excinuclease UvrABC ATPase subunit [Variovorax ginsengisoli]